MVLAVCGHCVVLAIMVVILGVLVIVLAASD
jgi:hypothetical protein